MKKAIRIVCIILAVIIVFAAGFIGLLTVTEYKPDDVTELEVDSRGDASGVSTDTGFTVLTFNTGYSGLGDNADFFMDGGKSVRSSDEERVTYNTNMISAYIARSGADFVFLQEVDTNSTRTYGTDQYEIYSSLYASSAFAYNYKCLYVPYPIPPMGTVNSGVATFSRYDISSAQRISLPTTFTWPVSAANLKRCALVSYVPIEGSDKQLVLINFHLEAYDDGSAKKAQTEVLVQLLESEYAKGNYVIAGGDFNQSMPGALEIYPVIDPDGWLPGSLDESMLPEGWSFAFDTSNASCRSLAAPYVEGETQLYLIDGFIVSPNLEIESVETVDLGFAWSDHNPVSLQISFK